jgi:ribosome maturation factor RimP
MVFMELSKYVGKYVKVELKNGYFYVGKVLGVHEKDISLKDKYGKFVDISIDAISFIVEVGE